jgi:tetratricopeptide (TPR) repeat protein
MKHSLALAALFCVTALSPVRAENADDQYVRIYNLIQQADALANQPAAALERYREAQAALQQFQTANPGWNPKVVNFRSTYLESRIFALQPRSPGAPAARPAPTPATPAPTIKPATITTVPPKTNAASDIERRLASLQEDVRRLQADKSTLESKLKEALATQPAAVDPRELAKAQEQVRSLMKENDLLKAGLEKEKSRPAPVADTKSPDDSKQILAEATRKLAEQTERANALAADRKNLQARLDALVAGGDLAAKLDAARKALEEANKQAAEQTGLAKKLAADNESLQARVKSLTTGADAAEALRTENALLKKQLADTKSPAPASGGGSDMARRLAQAEARIATLQSDAEMLRMEKIALENRVRALGGQTPTSPTVASTVLPPTSRKEDLARITQLEDERAELLKKLDSANKQLYGSKSKTVAARVDDLASQVTNLRARLEVFEARAVPYTTEELALFKKPETQLAAADPKSGKTSVKELPSGAAQLAASAQKHFSARQFDQAEKEYLEILRRDEKNVYTLANLAAIQLELGHLDEAEKHIKQALVGTPDDAYSLSILGYVKFRQEKYDDALDALSRAAKLNPQSAEIQNYLGVTLGHKGMRDAAEQALRRAIVIDPGYGSAHNNLAVIYASQQPPAIELARWHYQRALAAGQPRNDELEKAFEQKAASTVSK